MLLTYALNTDKHFVVIVQIIIPLARIENVRISAGYEKKRGPQAKKKEALYIHTATTAAIPAAAE